MSWAPQYVTLEQQRDYMRIEDTDDDAEILDDIEAASRAIDRCCNRQFGRVAAAEQRFYTAKYDRSCGLWRVPIDDLTDDTELVAETLNGEGTVVGAIDSYRLEPRNAVAKGLAWTELVINSGSTYGPSYRDAEVAVTATWGWPSVPDTIRSACKLQTLRFFNRRDSPYGVAGSPEEGSEMRLLAKVDPDVDLMLRPYRRLWVAA